MDFARNIQKFNRLDSQLKLSIPKVPTYGDGFVSASRLRLRKLHKSYE